MKAGEWERGRHLHFDSNLIKKRGEKTGWPAKFSSNKIIYTIEPATAVRIQEDSLIDKHLEFKHWQYAKMAWLPPGGGSKPTMPRIKPYINTDFIVQGIFWLISDFVMFLIGEKSFALVFLLIISLVYSSQSYHAVGWTAEGKTLRLPPSGKRGNWFHFSKQRILTLRNGHEPLFTSFLVRWYIPQLIH